MTMTFKIEIIVASAIFVAAAWVAILLKAAPGRKRQKPAKTASCEQIDAKQGQGPDSIFILVHGTFGWNASWLRQGSLLRRSLRRSSAGASLIQRVSWSGFNSFSGRTEAARRIQNQVAANATQWPRARQIIVAHSHGGTAAMQAMSDPSCGTTAAGVICMATPFLVSTGLRSVALSRGTEDALMVIRIYMTGAVLFGLLRLATPSWLWDPMAAGLHKLAVSLLPAFTVEFRIVDLLWSFGIFVAIGGFFWASTSLLRRWTAKEEQKIERALVCSTLTAARLLIVRQPGDEAGGAIGGTQAVNWLLGLMTRVVSQAIGLSDGAIRRARWSHSRGVWILAGIALLTACGAMLAGGDWTGPFSVISNAIEAIFFAFSVFFVALFLLAVPVSLAGAILFLLHTASITLSALATGPEMLLAGERLRVTAEPTPPGTWQVTTLPIYSETYRERPMVGDLWHSYLYENPKAIALISQWVTDLHEQATVAAGHASSEPNAKPEA